MFNNQSALKLLNNVRYISSFVETVDPDQLASSEAN